MGYHIAERTIGFGGSQIFDSVDSAEAEISEIAKDYRKNKNAYKIASDFSDFLNINEHSWKYSEEWEIKTAEDSTVKTLYINREHFPDGSCNIVISSSRFFGNYKK